MDTQKQKEAVLRELGLSKHDFTLLNGMGDTAKAVIVPVPFKSGEELVKHFSSSGKGKYGVFYDKVEDTYHKKVLLHLPVERIIAYLDAKTIDAKEAIIAEAATVLFSLDEARLAKELLELKIKEANAVIGTTEETIAKLTGADTQLATTVKSTITSLRAELEKPHPDLGQIDMFIKDINDNAGKLIGEEQIGNARTYADTVIAKVRAVLNMEETPNDLKSYFTERMGTLTALREGNDFLKLEETATSIDQELTLKTDKKLRAEEKAIGFVTKLMARITLQNMFPGKGTKYADVIKNVMAVIESAYSSYNAGLGRFGRKQNPLETFTQIERAALRIATAEIVAVHNGNDDIDSVMDSIETGSISFSEVDKQLSNLQAASLNITVEDLTDPAKRLDAIKVFLGKVKDAIKTFLTDQVDYTDSDANALVNGPLFSEALNLIAGLVSTEFYELKKEKEVKA